MKDNVLQLTKSIKYILDTKEVLSDGSILEKEAQRFYGEKDYIISKQSLEIDSEEEYIVAKYKDENWTDLFTIMDKAKKDKIINLIVVVNNLKTKQELEERYVKREIVNKFNQTHTLKLKLKNLIVTMMFISDKIIKSFSVEIESRIKSMEMPWNDSAENSTSGYVFTAKLYDIVNIYNSIGDVLFENNVRYEIKDELDVNKEITSTLENRPNEFWFLNNGITIVIQDEKFNLARSRSILLQYSSKTSMSVINGAQTVTTAAKFFNKEVCEDTEDAKKKKEGIEIAKRDAKVILRIMNISTDKTKFKTVADKISIALNRQKSIKTEDIAFTFSFVEKINNLIASDEKYFFELLKRGEEKSRLYSYELIEFARLAKSYLLQQPGSGRNSATDILLKCINQNGIFVLQDDMFKDFDNNEDFLKYYKPINFGMKVLKQFDDYCIDEKASPNQVAAFKYGRYYFVAFVIWAINDGKNDTFLDFDVDYKKVDTQVNSFIKLFAEAVEECLADMKIITIESNDFKNEKIYDYMKHYIIESDSSVNGIKSCQLYTTVKAYFK